MAETRNFPPEDQVEISVVSVKTDDVSCQKVFWCFCVCS